MGIGNACSKTKSNHVVSAESGDSGGSEHEKNVADDIEESCTGLVVVVVMVHII